MLVSVPDSTTTKEKGGVQVKRRVELEIYSYGAWATVGRKTAEDAVVRGGFVCGGVVCVGGGGGGVGGGGGGWGGGGGGGGMVVPGWDERTVADWLSSHIR